MMGHGHGVSEINGLSGRFGDLLTVGRASQAEGLHPSSEGARRSAVRTNLPLIALEAMAAVKNRLPYPNFHDFDMKQQNPAE